VVSPFRKNKALSEVVTTLILLVVAVLLAAVVTYYATNITMTRTESEELRISKAHVWVNGTGAIAAFKLQNLGGKDVLLDKITVRGVESPWTDVFIYRIPSTESYNDDLTVCNYTLLADNMPHLTYTFSAVTEDIPLESSGVLLVYIKDPDNIQMDDIGTAVSITMFTNNAQYITECNVESATTQ
jgi:flagellin-like protein